MIKTLLNIFFNIYITGNKIQRENNLVLKKRMKKREYNDYKHYGT